MVREVAFTLFHIAASCSAAPLAFCMGACVPGVAVSWLRLALAPACA